MRYRARLWLVALVLVLTLLPALLMERAAVPAAQAAALLDTDEKTQRIIYRDLLPRYFHDWSYSAEVDWQERKVVHGGIMAVRVTLQPWGVLRIHYDAPWETGLYTWLEFYLHPGDVAYRHLAVYLEDQSKQAIKRLDLTRYAEGGAIQPGRWQRVRIPLADLQAPAVISGIAISDTAGAGAPPFYLDDIRMVAAALPPAEALRKMGRQSGIHYVTSAPDQLGSEESDRSLAEAVMPLGVTWLTLPVPSDSPPTDAALTHGLAEAHRLGLKVLLQPVWQGAMPAPATDQGFRAYVSFVSRYAVLAAQAGADGLALGAGVEPLPAQERRWREFVSRVRGIYRGPVLFVAPYGQRDLPWWDAVDAIGISHLPPLRVGLSPGPAELAEGWRPVVQGLEQLSARWNRPVLLAGAGFRSVDGALAGRIADGAGADLQEQAAGYQSLMDAFGGKEWWLGVHWCCWSPAPEAEDPEQTGITPAGKPAEDLLRAWGGGPPRRVPTSRLLPDERRQLRLYDDQRAGGWHDWSYSATVDWAGVQRVAAGQRAIHVVYRKWGALVLHTNGVDTTPYHWLEFSLYVDDGVPGVAVQHRDAQGRTAETMVQVKAYLSPSTPSGQWARVRIPLADFDAAGKVVTTFEIKDRDGQSPEVWVDEIRLVGAVEGPPEAPPALPEVRRPFDSLGLQKGVTFVIWDRDAYNHPSSDRTLAEVIQPMGANWITLVATWYAENHTSTENGPRPGTPSDESLRHAIETAHKLGLKVLLKPHLDLEHQIDGFWKAYIDFGADQKAWAAWFESYTRFMLHYADLARETGADALSIGLELSGTTYRSADWRELIRRVRGRYAGPLTYGAHSLDETTITWWDAVDAIGVNTYYVVSKGPNPTVSEMQTGWEPIVDAWEALTSRWNRPLIVTEFGAQSLEGAAQAPWGVTEPVAAYDQQEQADYYRAFFQAITGKPWFQGVHLWAQTANPLDTGPYQPDFPVSGKLAEAVVREFYGAPPRTEPPRGWEPDPPGGLRVHTIYADEPADGWVFASWDVRLDAGSTDGPYRGSSAVAADMETWSGFRLEHPGVDSRGYQWLEFAIRVEELFPWHIYAKVGSRRDPNPLAAAVVANYIEGGVPVPGVWQRVRIPLAEWESPRTITHVELRAGRASRIFVDEVRLTGPVR